MTHVSVRALRGLALFAAPLAILPSALVAQTTSQPSTPLPPLDVTAAPKAQAKRPAAAPKRAAQVPAQPAPLPAPVAQTSAPGTQIAPGIPATAGAQPVSTITRDRVENTRAFSVGDLLQEVPGISIKQGNGPRDMGVSIRGSNARNGFAVRNIQVFEDGFPVTQPDGLSRTDLTDPHAYGGVDVWRGPSSALFGNYATGGAINFRTRPGGEINGFEYGVDVGSFGYVNNYMALGEKTRFFEYALFASDVRSTGHLDYNGFNTQTVNLTASYTPSSSDKFTFKFIHNALDTQLSVRLSMNQFLANPFQSGCAANFTTALGNAGCGSVSVFRNGFNSTRESLTAAQAGLNRHDYRTIAGIRWEHKVDANTSWQVQAVLDDRDISQPTSASSAVGDYLSGNFMGSVSQRYSFFGMPAMHMVGAWYNTLPNDAYTYNLMPGGNATTGRLSSTVNGGTLNAGARIREEIRPDSKWTVVLGTSIEETKVSGVSTTYTYPVANNPAFTTTQVGADRQFMNHASEFGLSYKADSQWLLRGRVATGYGTPQIGNLFVTPAGVDGNNTQLASQTNLGYDVGFDWTPSRAFKVSVTGFYEFFENELVTQSPGANLKSFTFNAPKSEHRGIELAAQWRPTSGWGAMAAYLYNDQIYTDYTERLSNGGFSNAFSRVGNKIPGNSPNELLARFGYDQPVGPLKGLGAYVEYQWKDAFFLDNGNFLKAPGYDLVNLNVHYKPELAAGPVKGLTMFFEVRNLFDKTYIASANNVSNSISAATGAENGASVLAASTGSIYTGMPQTFYGGMKVKF